MIAIKCPSCGTLFGYENDEGVLNIKHRDLFREIRGQVSGPCRRCGNQVTWSSSRNDVDGSAPNTDPR